jgi:hypothetical protein
MLRANPPAHYPTIVALADYGKSCLSRAGDFSCARLLNGIAMAASAKAAFAKSPLQQRKNGECGTNEITQVYTYFA